jgi:hypothetical protein
MHLEMLVESVESSACWRSQKADQYPDDKRNQRSSAALEKLAERLRKLPTDNEHAQTYEAILERLVELDQAYQISEHESHYIGRYGFDYPEDGDPEAFLTGLNEHYQELVEEAEEEKAEEERERAYETACQTAGEEAKAIADKGAREVAEKVAKQAAEKAYKKAYAGTYEETYDEAYRKALIEAPKV